MACCVSIPGDPGQSVMIADRGSRSPISGCRLLRSRNLHLLPHSGPCIRFVVVLAVKPVVIYGPLQSMPGLSNVATSDNTGPLSRKTVII